VEINRKNYKVVKMAKIFGISRSSYYSRCNHKKSRREIEDEELMKKVKEIFEDSRQEYGERRIKKALDEAGTRIGRPRVNRLMKKLNLVPKAKRKFKVTTKQSKKAYYVAPNLLNQKFIADRPNQIWVTDITYIHTQEGWLYAASVLDLFSRKIVGLAMSQRITVDLVLRAVGQAVKRRNPPAGLIIHSDRGSQYTSKAYHKFTKKHGLIISMSSTGNCFDNAVAESFFHTLKIAVVHDVVYLTRNQATRAVFEYVEIFYNRQRMHSALDYLTPEQFEQCWFDRQFVSKKFVQ